MFFFKLKSFLGPKNSSLTVQNIFLCLKTVLQKLRNTGTYCTHLELLKDNKVYLSLKKIDFVQDKDLLFNKI